VKPIRIILYAFCVVLVLALSVKVQVNTPPGYGLDMMPRLGADADYNFSTTAVSAAGRSGARMLRSHVSWTTLEPTNTDPSHYNWAFYDPIFSRIASNGLMPILVIDKCPTWACPFMRGPINSANMSDYTEMVTALVNRYRQPPYNVHFWELFDEPDAAAGVDGQLGYGNHAAEYVEALRILHDAVKAVDPESVVMNGGLAYDRPTIFRPEFLTETLALGAAQYIDALNFHYFLVNGAGWATIADKASEIRAVMRNVGVSVPLVCTSTGESSANISPWFSTEEQQARYLVQVNAQSAAAGVRATIWYLVQDFTCQPSSGCPTGWEVWAHHGLVKQDGSNKRALTAMQTFAQEIGSGLYQRQLGAESGVTGGLEGYLFAGSSPGRPQVSVIWNNDPTATPLIVPAAQVPNLLGAVDLLGQAITLQPGAGGVLTVGVGNDPIYLEWRSPRFVDVPVGSPFYTYVEPMAQMGAVSGFVDGTFRPNDVGMRGHISKMVVLASGWPTDTTGGPHFVDVPTTSPFYEYVETAYNRHVISGYSDGTFRPYNSITRGQLCKIVANARGWELLSPAHPTFNDVSTTDAFYTYIETAYSHGVISGYNDGTFRPGNTATRGQVTKVVYNAISR
jgi:hypothetical protein